jgi:predicted nuclease of predicted toxin-antitoxin system
MNFLFDENFPKSARAILENAGHEVFDFRRIGIIGSPDDAIVQMALEKSAVILTTDRDFFQQWTSIQPSIPPVDVPFWATLLKLVAFVPLKIHREA